MMKWNICRFQGGKEQGGWGKPPEKIRVINSTQILGHPIRADFFIKRAKIGLLVKRAEVGFLRAHTRVCQADTGLQDVTTGPPPHFH